MATITIDLEPGERVVLAVSCEEDEWVDDDPEPTEEEPPQRLKAVGE